MKRILIAILVATLLCAPMAGGAEVDALAQMRQALEEAENYFMDVEMALQIVLTDAQGSAVMTTSVQNIPGEEKLHGYFSSNIFDTTSNSEYYILPDDTGVPIMYWRERAGADWYKRGIEGETLPTVMFFDPLLSMEAFESGDFALSSTEEYKTMTVEKYTAEINADTCKDYVLHVLESFGVGAGSEDEQTVAALEAGEFLLPVTLTLEAETGVPVGYAVDFSQIMLYWYTLGADAPADTALTCVVDVEFATIGYSGAMPLPESLKDAQER